MEIWRCSTRTAARCAAEERQRLGYDPVRVPRASKGDFFFIGPHRQDRRRLGRPSHVLTSVAGRSPSAGGRHSDRSTRSQLYDLDYHPPQGQQGRGVKALCRRIGTDLRRTAVIGPICSMTSPCFNEAGFSIAMGQAPAAVQSSAQAITLSNTEDGLRPRGGTPCPAEGGRRGPSRASLTTAGGGLRRSNNPEEV
jgi:hypothetical protein